MRMIAPETLAAAMGWCEAAYVMPMAAASSVVESAMFETGSGLGVTTARKAVLELCVAMAMRPPAVVAASCMPGERCSVAR